MELKQKILQVATALAERVGVAAVSRNMIADKAECAMSAVSYHYGDVKHIHRAIVTAAITNKNLKVLGFAIAERHPLVVGDKLPADVHAAALRVHLGR
jgi:AcrR family transcriptional regulator